MAVDAAAGYFEAKAKALRDLTECVKDLIELAVEYPTSALDAAGTDRRRSEIFTCGRAFAIYKVARNRAVRISLGTPAYL